MYKLFIKRQAKRKLQVLPVTARTKIVGQIHILGNDPDDQRLDIEKIGARGDVYK